MDVCLDDGSKDLEKEVHDTVLRFLGTRPWGNGGVREVLSPRPTNKQ